MGRGDDVRMRALGFAKLLVVKSRAFVRLCYKELGRIARFFFACQFVLFGDIKEKKLA